MSKINQKTKNAVVSFYYGDGERNKAKTARKFKISSRSVGRIIKTEVLSKLNPTPELRKLMKGEGEDVPNTNSSPEECGIDDLDTGEYLVADSPNSTNAPESDIVIEKHNSIPKDTTIVNWTGGLKFISLVLSNGESITINSDDKRYDGVKEALWNEDIDKALEIADSATEIKKWSKNGVVIRNGQLTVHGKLMTGAVVDHIIQSFETGRDFDKYVNFYIKLLQNTDSDSVRQLLPFMKHNDIDVDSDGNIIAWKMVDQDYKDHFTGKMDNSVGAEPWMPREDVVDNPKKTCEAGLHVCAKAYIGFFSDSRIVKVLIDPANVVSVPNDYNGAKMRVCRYKVIEDVTETFTK
ncbi:MAG: hypothetical protein CL489_08725 [Acidobacteria bacterium]|nr:hypothetical protein [Acidobacteriota bacterium]|tara:strand:- start:25437 stop:26489 length:1053 start_codon:yes stop_codon:yes gene_type:complete